MINNGILEALKTVWWNLLIISFFVAIISFFWGFVDLIILMCYKGKIKRGIKVWSKPLSDDFRNYLLALQNDIVETRKTWFHESKIRFIRIENREVIIYSRRPHWGTSWPYIGYVDLSEPEAVLQFRSSLPMHLFLLPFILTGIATPFVLLLLVFNYYMESTAIENFLKKKSVEKMTASVHYPLN
jgi:hypothetical protein